MGSLSLYRSYVKKILPGDGALKRMKEAIEETVEEKALLDFSRRTHLICVGGTARAALKLCKKVYHLTPGSPHHHNGAAGRAVPDAGDWRPERH